MAEKLIFSMQVFFLGISVVMVVLFALYGLTDLFNRISAHLAKKEKPVPDPDPADSSEGLSPQVAAAIAAAINFHRSAEPGHAGVFCIPVDLPDLQGSRWAAEGRKALLDNSLQLDLSRRKRT